MDQSSSFVLMLIDMELHKMWGRKIDMLAQTEQKDTYKKPVLDNTVLLHLQVAKFLCVLVKHFDGEWANSLQIS